MKFVTRRNFVVFLICSCFFTILFVFFVGYGLLLLHPAEEFNDVHEYQRLHVNEETNIFSFGSVTLQRHLSEDEYIFQDDHEGNQMLISNFGTNSYFCSGSCTCEEETERRNIVVSSPNNNVLIKGIRYLVVAATSSLAMKKSRDYFEEECRRRISAFQPCDFSKVKAKVEFCDWVDDKTDDEPTMEERPNKIFKCKGYCLINQRLRNPSSIQYAEEIDCQNFELETEINLKGLRSSFEITDRKFARLIYLRDHLTPYCKEETTVGYLLPDSKSPQPIGNKADKDDWHYTFALCVGYRGSLVEENFNPSAKCIREA